ncbi:MAG TPA: aldehyde ferredoxin oxidoreductase family protein [Firmicutes bacterium]|nr:aldehyde ferredoxin oxidoreductase family protein [Bacillota bacterium]
MAYGFGGKILRVDLTHERIEIEKLDDAFYRRYIGGMGFVAYHLLREVKPGTDPLGPDNRLYFFTGVLTGIPVPGTGRNSIGAKSPLTGGFGESEVGGFFGVELKRTGYDGIIIEGKASHPVYLVVHDDTCEIRGAEPMWGKSTKESREMILEELGDDKVKLAQIGVAGENQVRIASIICDLRYAAGRGGMGAVMGSKNLKAVAVRGTKKPAIARPDKVMELARWMADNSKALVPSYHDIGTGSGVIGMSQSGGLPTRNFRSGSFEGVESLSPYTMRGNILKKMDGCFACPVKCKRVVEVESPYRVDPAYGGAEYETIASFGSNCGISDLRAIAKAHELCNAHSLDTISTGVAVSFAMECYENGILTKEDTGGLDLRFGNAEAMLALVDMIARREGLGAILAEGTARAAQRIGKGSERFAIHSKGQEIPMHEPRWKRGLGIGYAVSPTGGEHCSNVHDPMYEKDTPDMESVRVLGIIDTIPIDDLGPRKVRLFTYLLLYRYLQNSLVVCQFVPWRPDQISDLVSATTGWNTSVWELLKVGERSANMARLFNLREGFTAQDDRLPERFFEPEEAGGLGGLDRGRFEDALELHYAMMGWDMNGVPTRGKLYELGLEWALD